MTLTLMTRRFWDELSTGWDVCEYNSPNIWHESSSHHRKHGVNIAGIVHLHDISVRDTTGKGIDFLRLNDSTNKVIPAITKWSDVDDQELAQRKQQLSEAYHIESNDIARFDRTAGSAWHIINLILDKDPSNGLPLLQELLKLRDSYPAIPKKIPTKKGFFARLFKRQVGLPVYHFVRTAHVSISEHSRADDSFWNWQCQ